MTDNKDLWTEVVEVFQYTKSLLLLVEENNLDGDFETFTQPLTEIRSAMDHLCRAQAAHFGIKAGSTEEYIIENLKKALGHLYRAFFDTADFMSILLRENITNELKGFSNEAISTVLPKYYPQIKPELEKLYSETTKINEKLKDYIDDDIYKIPDDITEIHSKAINANSIIANIREHKDIDKDPTINLIIQYDRTIKGLLNDHQFIGSCKKALIDFEMKEKRKTNSSTVRAIIIGVLSGLLVLYIHSKISNLNNSQPPVKINETIRQAP